MLFSRVICSVVAATFVVFTTASPIQELSVDMMNRALNADANIGTLPGHRQATANFDDGAITDGGADIVGVDTIIQRHNIGHLTEARETLQSLPDVLSSAKDQLIGVQAQAKSLNKNGEKFVAIDTIRPCLDKVHSIFIAVLVKIKLFEGEPVNVILGGCAIIEIAKLLCTVLTLVVKILFTLITCAGPKSDMVINIIVKTISVALCELLTLVLGLVDGLLVQLLPLLADILGLLMGCGLGGVLKVLGH